MSMYQAVGQIIMYHVVHTRTHMKHIYNIDEYWIIFYMPTHVYIVYIYMCVYIKYMPNMHSIFLKNLKMSC